MENPKQAAFAQLALVAKAFAHPNRLELLEFLAQGESNVEFLASRTKLSVGNASQHLQLLRRAGVATSRKSGQQVLYRIAAGEVINVLQSLRGVAEQNLAELQSILRGYFERLDDVEPISREDLIQRMDSGEVCLLDVRPAAEHRAGHIPGSINIPFADLEQRLGELDSNREVIAYCRGPYCVLSFEAVAALRDKGYQIRRLEEGFPEWQNEGRDVATG